MKPFEYPKDFLLELRVDPDPVVLYRKTPIASMPGARHGIRGNVDPRSALIPILESVADQILEYLLQMRLRHGYPGQRIPCHRRPGFPDRLRQV